MSQEEIEKIAVIESINAKKISQKEGAKRLGRTTRHMRRLQEIYKSEGPQGLINKKIGKPSNNIIKSEVKATVISLIRSHYADFGPKLAAEMLSGRHEIEISKETSRQLMMGAGIWKGKLRKDSPEHPMRDRKPCFGEFIQIDGSPHAWFEDRAEKCCLIVLIDDATSFIVGARFATVESTEAYFDTFFNYIKTYGRPLEIYSDRHSIFRINLPEAKSGDGSTQFSRAMDELGILHPTASSPQAKGRVERVNHTLQDRLVKMMRLDDITGIEAGNKYLKNYLEIHNELFSVPAFDSEDVHRKEIPEDEVLKLLFSHQETRIVSKTLNISYENVTYQLQVSTPSYSMHHAKILVCKNKDGITLIYKNKVIPYKTFDRKNQSSQVLSVKEIAIKKPIARTPQKPAENHPWRTYENLIKKPAQAASAKREAVA